MMKLILVLTAFLSFSCGNSPSPRGKASKKVTLFFTDYVKSDGPTPDTLPVFLRACGGDEESLDQIFTNYERFGSGDNEAWVDVPDRLLAELGDQKFFAYVSQKPPTLQIEILMYLGFPGLALDEDLKMREMYPKTSALQRSIFDAYPNARP